jgi:hypothetical protein
VGRKCNFWILYQLVLEVSTGIYRVNLLLLLKKIKVKVKGKAIPLQTGQALSVPGV